MVENGILILALLVSITVPAASGEHQGVDTVGKSFKNGRGGERGGRGMKGNNRRMDQEAGSELTSTPFKEALKDVKVPRYNGPKCLKCGDSIDSRLAASAKERNGTKQVQRHGWLHSACEATLSTKFYVEEWVTKYRDGEAVAFLKTVHKNQGLALPVYSAEELQDLMSGAGGYFPEEK